MNSARNFALSWISKRKKSLLDILFLSGGLVMVLTGCGKTSVNLNALANINGPSSTPSGPSTPSNPQVGVVDNNSGFYVRAIANEDSDYVVHAEDLDLGISAPFHSSARSYNYANPCKINPGDPNRDVICYVEGNELDLYFFGLTLQHNIPSSMCSYGEILMPYYYKYPVATGPLTSRTRKNASGAIQDVENSSGGSPYCAYDFTKDDIPGPNCCLGKYGSIAETVGPDPQATVTPAPMVTTVPAAVEAAWGGDASKCLSGPALDIQKKTRDGFPKADLYYIEGIGLNGKYVVPSPLSKELSSNFYVANYFTSTSYSENIVNSPGPPCVETRNPYTGELTVTGSCVALFSLDDPATSSYDDLDHFPAAFRLKNNPTVPAAKPSVASDPYGHLDRVSQPFYEYRCLNRAREVLYRIRLMVRSWNILGQAGVAGLGSYGNDQDVGLNPPRAGVGISAGAVSPPEGTPFDQFVLQDFAVWDLVSGSYCPTQVIPAALLALTPTLMVPNPACGISSPFKKGFPAEFE